MQQVGSGDDLDPAADLLVADLLKQLRVVAAHVVADVRENGFVGLTARDEAALAPDLSCHGTPPFGPAVRMLRASDYRPSVAAEARIQLCGRFAIEVDGVRLETRLPGRQGRLLFAYLALNRDRPVTRGELVEAVWGELTRGPPDALAPLLSKVRAALGDQRLLGRSELQLVLPAGTRVDVEEAITAVHEAESACALGEWPRAWAASLSGQLVARRPLLAGFEAAWIDDRRRILDDVLLRSLECYTHACLGVGGTERAGGERAARELVRLAPLRESASALLMEALEQRGNVAEALLVYESLRQRLRDELGVAPAQPLQDVYRRLLGTSTS